MGFAWVRELVLPQRSEPTQVTVHQEEISISTPGFGFVDASRKVQEVVSRSGVTTGMCTVFIRHTSASLVIQENADPAVTRDLQRWMNELAPESRSWEHDDEGADDMPAHAKSAITKTSESIPIGAGKLLLGTWQGLYVWEHRKVGHQRRLVVHISGD